ncbi:MAG: acyl-CoA dehydrogenase [Frankiales bacterium]|nr:acyl-CoA dehydrogenase [Frankiales bacterium]
MNAQETAGFRDAYVAYLNSLLAGDTLRLLHDEERSATAPPRTESLRRKLIARMGAAGWLGVGFPEELGGRPGTNLDQVALVEESERLGAPLPLITLMTVAPTLLQYGTDEQRERYLRPVLRGHVEFAIGYTEPSAGTDLASLRTRAEIRGDELVINGSKIFTSNADLADYIWLAVRTDPDAEKHAGISIVIVPVDTPGVSVTTINTLAEHRTTATFYDNVVVPVSNLVGGLGGGWRLMTSQLNRERLAMAARVEAARGLLRDVIDWASRTPVGNGVLAEQPWARTSLADAYVRLSAARLFVERVARAETPDRVEASMAKAYGTEAVLEALRLMLEVSGNAGLVRGEDAMLSGRLEHAYRRAVINTFGGGTNEIQRQIIASSGLDLPRAL